MNAFWISNLATVPLYQCVKAMYEIKISRIHVLGLRLIYNWLICNLQLTFEELLEKHDSVLIHIRNLQTLAIEMYKVENGGSPEIMKEIFRIFKESGYNLRPSNIF